MKKSLAVMLIFICISGFFRPAALAGSELSGERRTSLWSGLHMRKVFSEPQKGTIGCFDVSETGMIAIGSSYSGREVIFIYNPDGNFEHSYTFELSGSCRFRWEGEALVIYFAREQASVSLDPEGRVLSIAEADISRVYPAPITEKRVGSVVYRLSNGLSWPDFPAMNPTKLIAAADNGSERIIYQADTPLSDSVLFLACAAVILTISIAAGRRKSR